MALSLPAAVALITVSTALIWAGSDLFEGASDRLSTYYGLPPVVQGAIVAAVGSSLPELATVVAAALLEGSLDLGVGAIVGSAIFNVLVIPAMAGLLTSYTVESNRAIVYKEALFYMLAVSVLVIAFAMATIYNPAPGGVRGTVTRPLAVLPLALYGIYVFIQSQDTADHVPDRTRMADIDPARSWARFLIGLALILIGVNFLVEAVADAGAMLGVPAFIMGVTVLAAATSLPDAFVTVRAARAGRAVAGLANVLGSNTFDLLVAIPVGILVAGALPIDFAMAVPMFGVLTAATIALFTALRRGFSLTEAESVFLLLGYLAFVVWVLLEAAGLVAGILPI